MYCHLSLLVQFLVVTIFCYIIGSPIHEVEGPLGSLALDLDVEVWLGVAGLDFKKVWRKNS